MRLLARSLALITSIALPGHSNADVKYPTVSELAGIRSVCAGGDVSSIDGQVEAALSGWRLMPRAQVDVGAAKKNLGAVMDHVNDSAGGNQLYREYVACVRDLLSKYLTRSNPPPPAPRINKETAGVNSRIQQSPTTPFAGSNSANSNTGPVIQGNNNTLWMSPGSSDSNRNFDRMIQCRSAILEAEAKFRSVDRLKVQGGDAEEQRRLLMLQFEVNSILRKNLDDVVPYIDQATTTQLRSDNNWLDEAEQRLSKLAVGPQDPKEVAAALLEYINRSTAFRSNFKRLLEDQIRKNS